MIAHLDPGQALEDLTGARKWDFREQLSGRPLQVVLFLLRRNLQRLIKRIITSATMLTVKIGALDLDAPVQAFQLPTRRLAVPYQAPPAFFTHVSRGRALVGPATLEHFLQDRARDTAPFAS